MSEERRKIYLATYIESDPKSEFHKKVMVSHGIDVKTFENIVLQNQPLEYYVKNCGAWQNIKDDQAYMYC